MDMLQKSSTWLVNVYMHTEDTPSKLFNMEI